MSNVYCKNRSIICILLCQMCSGTRKRELGMRQKEDTEKTGKASIGMDCGKNSKELRMRN